MPKTKTNDPGAHHASSGALIRRFLPYLANYKMVLCLDLFCAALTTLCDIVLPKIMSTITNSAMGVGITLTAGIVLKLAALYFVLRIIDGAASYYMSSIGHIMGVHIETDMRRDAFDHLLQLDHTYYNNTKVGTIMGRITNDLFDVTEFAHHCPEEFFIAGIKIVASFVILCRASIPLTLAVFACVPLMGVVSVYLNGRLRARFRQQRVQIGELNSTIEDSLLGQGVVKAFAAEDEEREKFARGNRAFEQIKTLGYYAMGAFNTSTRLFDGLMYLVVILAGGLSLVYGKITAGDLVAYMLYVTTLIATIRRIVEFAEQFQRGMTGIERFAEIMDTPVAIKDAPDAVPLQPGPGEIRFEKVCFEYPDDHNKVLHDVSLDIRAGERLALVGASGGGKTTLCNLIPRFYEVTSGRILIDGQDIRRVTLKSLRQDIGIVQQDVYLFSGTVAQPLGCSGVMRLQQVCQMLVPGITTRQPDGLGQDESHPVAAVGKGPFQRDGVGQAAIKIRHAVDDAGLVDDRDAAGRHEDAVVVRVEVCLGEILRLAVLCISGHHAELCRAAGKRRVIQRILAACIAEGAVDIAQIEIGVLADEVVHAHVLPAEGVFIVKGLVPPMLACQIGRHIGAARRNADAEIEAEVLLQAAVQHASAVNAPQAATHIDDTVFHGLFLHRLIPFPSQYNGTAGNTH